MGGVAASVRHIAFPLACSLVLGSTVEAQVAIQVKSGTTWTSNIELSALAPITFRWRWDGAETPTSVAWQLATVTPTSTATTRATDVIASETPMKLPAKAGVYEEFTVSAASSWPAKFYIRVRVNVARKAVYSRWVIVTVVQRTDVASNPTCAMDAWKVDLDYLSTNPWASPAAAGKVQRISPAEVIDGAVWNYEILHFVFRNRLTAAPVSYRRRLTSNWIVDGKDLLGAYRTSEGSELMNAETVRTLAAGKADTLAFLLAGNGVFPRPKGLLKFDGAITPVSGPGSTCSLTFTVKAP